MKEKQSSLTIFREANLCRMEHRSILRFPYEKIDNAWILVSFGRDRPAEDAINKINRENRWPDEFRVHSCTTFFFDNDGVGAEWEPSCGPIQIWHRCDESWRGETERGNPIEPRKHWFYDWVEDRPLNWSQLAVDREQLRENLVEGDLDAVFHSLEIWSKRR